MEDRIKQIGRENGPSLVESVSFVFKKGDDRHRPPNSRMSLIRISYLKHNLHNPVMTHRRSSRDTAPFSDSLTYDIYFYKWCSTKVSLWVPTLMTFCTKKEEIQGAEEQVSLICQLQT